MKWLTFVLLGLLALTQYLLWFGEDGINDYWELKQQVIAQRRENQRLHERNQALAAEVADLKSGLDAVEARARMELGMVKPDEVFYQVLEVRPRTVTPNDDSPVDER